MFAFSPALVYIIANNGLRRNMLCEGLFAIVHVPRKEWDAVKGEHIKVLGTRKGKVEGEAWIIHKRHLITLIEGEGKLITPEWHFTRVLLDFPDRFDI